MPRPRHITDTGHEEIEHIAIARAMLPSDVELSTKHGVSRRRVQQIMRKAREAFVPNPVASSILIRALSESSDATHTPAPCQNSDAVRS